MGRGRSRKGMHMDMTCHKCGYRSDFLEFAYLCKNGCPACGESDLRRCPRCGAECVFSRAESLEDEEVLIGKLVTRLTALQRTQDKRLREEAAEIIGRLRDMNQRWNIPKLQEFLKQRQRELFF